MRKWTKLAVAALFLLVATLLVPGSALGASKQTNLVSVDSAGAHGNGPSGIYPASISANSRYVAFDSAATNLVASDTNGFADVFVRDRKLHKTFLVSVGPAGVQGNGASGLGAPSISADGRFVAFVSNATNLVPGDSNGFADVFVRDRKLHKTYRLSVDSAGVQGDGASSEPFISPDGRYVAFQSAASNLVAGDSNGFADVFVRDRKLHRTYRVSVGPAGVQANGTGYYPSISADGRYVAFESDANNLVPGDSNGYLDIFVRDRKLHKTVRVSVGPAGVQANGSSYVPSLSSNGRYVAFESFATNLVSGDSNGYLDVFVRDRKLHKTTLASVDSAGVQGNNQSFDPSISADGRYVAFDTLATNLTPGDTNGVVDVLLRDRKLHKTVRVSVDSAGVQGDHGSFYPAVSADDRYVVFDSLADNLVVGDTNGFSDAFVRGRFR